MSIANDREIEGNIRSLQILAQSPQLRSGDLRSFYRPALHARSMHTAWLNVILTAIAAGRQVLNLRVPLGAKLPMARLEQPVGEAIVKSGRPYVNNSNNRRCSKTAIDKVRR
jgi:hypothetical protein